MAISPEKQDRGDGGEERMYRLLRQWRTQGLIEGFCRPDFLVVPGGRRAPFLIEAKQQDHFEGPPFDGHGITEHQVRRYTEVVGLNGMRTRVVVFEGPARFSAWLDELRAGEEYVTAKARRHIWPLANFDVKESEV